LLTVIRFLVQLLPKFVDHLLMHITSRLKVLIYLHFVTLAADAARAAPTSNGNASETKANESFDNGVFFDIEAKRTPSIYSKQIIFETKRTH
jgi:hypothetical protein